MQLNQEVGLDQKNNKKNTSYSNYCSKICNNIIGVQIVRSLRAFIQSIMLSGIEAETATVALQGATLLKSGLKWPEQYSKHHFCSAFMRPARCFLRPQMRSLRPSVFSGTRVKFLFTITTCSTYRQSKVGQKVGSYCEPGYGVFNGLIIEEKNFKLIRISQFI